MSVTFESIEKSYNDQRSYRHITLPNKLSVLLVSDPETQKSAACCDVNVGSLCDPVEAPGLAHFLEHMLFMGTEKYPIENGYSSFLNSHGGHSNAYTSQENTVYYFDIQNEHFEEAINMFSSFFTCPLFNESSTSREITAVDNENTKNLQSDMWRFFQLMKSMARPGHPFNKFSTGNKETLETYPTEKGLNIHDILLSFYDKYYSANIMKFVLYGKEPLDVLQNWAEQKLSSVPNKDLNRPVFDSDPYPVSNLPKHLEVVPIKDTKTILIHFPFPEVNSMYLSKPGNYLSHLVGHESDGSILAALKSKGYANGLGSFMAESYADFACFGLTIDITEQGLTHFDEIVECVHTYLGMLKREGPKEWIVQEVIETQRMNFRYLSKTEPSSYVTALANNMQLYPVDKILSGNSLTFEINLQNITKLFGYLTPENAIYVFRHQGFDGVTTHTEKWYGTKYNEHNLKPAQSTMWKEAIEGKPNQWSDLLYLPKPNDFLPTDFSIRHTGEKVDVVVSEDRALPVLIQREVSKLVSSSAVTVAAAEGEEEDDLESYRDLITESGRKLLTWFLPDKSWLIPKTNVIIKLESNHAYSSPLNVALTDMLANILEDVLIKISYYADCAGLHYSVQNSRTGLDLTFYGFHHKLPVLVAQVFAYLKSLANMKASALQDTYLRIKEKVLLGYKNFKFSQPYMHCIVGSLNCIEDPRWTVTEKLLSLKSSTLFDFQSFASLFIRALHTEMFIHGNENSENAKELSDKIQQELNASFLPQSELPCKRIVELTPGVSYLYRQHANCFNKNEINSAIENLYFICEEENISGVVATRESPGVEKWGRIGTEALLQLVAHMMSEPAFDQLRTKEQLGYIVHTATVKFTSYLAFRVIVQSNSKDGGYLDERIENFILDYRSTLESISADDMQNNIQAVIETLLEKPKNLKNETNKFWEEINSGAYYFNRKIKQANYLRNVKLSDILEFYDLYLNASSPVRTKFSSQYYGANHAYPDTPPVGVKFIKDHVSFKRSMMLRPSVNNSELVKLVE